MKTTFKIILILALTLMWASWEVYAQAESRSKKIDSIGFEDKNHDGMNDRFQDADGDGVNDVTGKPYPHKFKFIDKNRDGVNDLWLDRDGDGVNDLSHKLDKKYRKDIRSNVLDFNQDGINDITGFKFKGGDFMGHKSGFIDERTGKIQGKFMDENGNGVDDRMEKTRLHNRHVNRDIFIDEDGDGICDGRGDALRRQSRSGRKHQRGKHR